VIPGQAALGFSRPRGSPISTSRFAARPLIWVKVRQPLSFMLQLFQPVRFREDFAMSTREIFAALMVASAISAPALAQHGRAIRASMISSSTMTS